MKKVLVLLAPGFEEIETTAVVDILRRAGARLVLAGTVAGPVEGSRGLRILPDVLLDEVADETYDLVILPGGQPGTDNLKADPRVHALLRKHGERILAAICAAPLVLQAAGLLAGRTVTSHPSVRDRLKDVVYSEERVVVDANLVTSRSPGTALEFACKLVEILYGPDRVEAINSGVLARI